MKRGEIWWADLGAYRAREQTGRRPVIVRQSDTLTRLLQSVLIVPLTTNLDRASTIRRGGLRRRSGEALDASIHYRGNMSTWRSLIRSSRHKARSRYQRRFAGSLALARARFWNGTMTVRRSWFAG